MSIPFPPFYADSFQAGSSIKTSLLSPSQISVATEPDDVPFRPSNNDHISLNMKRKKHKHRDHDRSEPEATLHSRITYARSHSAAEVLGADEVSPYQGPLRSNSLELLFQPGSASISSLSPGVASSVFEGENVTSRRWTLASKSEPTRGFTPLRSTVTQTFVHEAMTESPAMITLRRATTNKSPKRYETEYTSFPEPVFSHERNGLLSYLVSTFSRAGTFDAAQFFDNSRDSSRSISVNSKRAHPTLTFPAATVCTETTVDASLAMPGIYLNKAPLRRCSTKYVSGETTFEVIWDENDTSTSTSTGESAQLLISDRRSSLAVQRLESTLACSNPSTRRASRQSKESSTKASINSVDMFREQEMTKQKLEDMVPRLLQKTGLFDLPRSRAARRRRDTVCSMTVDEPEPQTLTGSGSRKPSAFTLDFFPPLQSRRPSSAVPWSSEPTVGVGQSMADGIALPQQLKARAGSLIGSSSHARRRSSTFTPQTFGQERASRHPPKIQSTTSSDHSCESDTEPLLSRKRKQSAVHGRRSCMSTKSCGRQ